MTENTKPVMSLNELQRRALEFAIYPREKAIDYPTLGLCGESGEVAEKVKKYYRDSTSLEDLREKLKGELFDVTWYVLALARDVGLTYEEIIEFGLAKLASRKERGVLQGSGDTR
jgi:NTP pyrophosphatase (non-canonical NTP hydrolase)